MSSEGPREEAADSFVDRLRRGDPLSAGHVRDAGEVGMPTRPDRGAGDGRPAEGRRDPSTPRLDESCPAATALRDAELGGVAHVGPPIDRRFGTERRVRTAAGRINVRAFRSPDAEIDGFEGALRHQLERWAALGDVDGVVGAVDHGYADRPWVATASMGPALGDREPPSLRRALRQVIHLAEALDACHDHGVVHAGIDPGNVVFTAGGDGPPLPALHNPGLVDVYRRYEDPAGVLDPRYAAPEFFGEDEGLVDRTTDVYGLGALCYRLVVGVPPVSGSAAAIADRVTAEEPFAAPSSVDPSLPESLDEVLLTATATDPFERYESAGDLHAALAAVLQTLPE
jgi:hypothetical protein